MAIQNVPLHHACFCCKRCGRKLSLVNYATFQGTFYCKSHHQLLAELKKRSQEENSSIRQRDQQLQIAVQPSPGLGSKNRDNQPGKLLTREKMQPRLSGLHSQVNLRPPRQARQETASQNKPRTSWPPLKEAAGKEIGPKYCSSGATKKPSQDTVLILQCRTGADGSLRRSIAEIAQAEKKQSQLPRVTFPKHSLHWIKTAGGSGDLRVLEKRQLFMGESILGARGSKKGLSIAERAMRFQGNPLKMKRSVPAVSPLASTPLASLPSRSEALRTSKATGFAASGVTVADASSLAKGSFKGKRLSGSSSSTGASDERSTEQILLTAKLLPKARVALPALAPPDSRQQLPEASKSIMSITRVREEAGQLSHISAEPTEVHKPSQVKAEASVSLPEHKDERSNDEKTLDSVPGSVETCLTADQVSEHSWEGRIEFPEGQMPAVIDPTSLQRPENQLYPETHNSKVAEEKRREKEIQAGGNLDGFETQNGVLQEVSQNSKPEERATTSDEEAELEGSHSASSSQAEDPQNIGVSQRNNSQGSTLTSNAAPLARQNLEPSDPHVKIANTNEEMPGKTSSENNIQLESQEDTFGRTSLQASKPQVKDQETFDSCEVPHLTEKQAMGSVQVAMKPQSEDGSVAQVICNKKPTNECAGKQKERNPLARLFASKTQGRVWKQEEEAGTKKSPKTQSALATLFGYSLEKGNNPKALAKPSMKTSNGEELSLVSFSNLPKLDTCKEKETSGLIQAKGSEAGLWDSEKNYESHTRDGQRESSPSLDGAQAFHTDTLPIEPSTGISSSIEVVSGTKSLEVPKQSNLKMETAFSDNSKSSLFASSQDSLATATENMLQCSTSSLMETNSEKNVASQGDLYNQDLQTFPNQADKDAQYLKAENVSLLGLSREDKAQRDYQVPDMLLFSMGVDRSASMEGSDLQSSPPDLDTGRVRVKNEACAGLSSSENISEVNNLHQFSESEHPRAISLNNNNTPGTGNSEMFQNPQFCLQMSEDGPLGLRVEKAAADGYPIGKVDIPLLCGSLQHIPELLRDTIQRNTEGNAAETEQSLEALMLAEKGDQSSGRLP